MLKPESVFLVKKCVYDNYPELPAFGELRGLAIA